MPAFSTYNPLQYVADINALLEQEDHPLYRGGHLAGRVDDHAAGDGGAGANRRAVLNDIGPVIEPEGLARIRDYVGQGGTFPTWMHAARALEEDQSGAFPDYQAADWLAMAKRVMVLNANGRIVYDYDMKIAEPFEKPGGEAGVDLWPGLEGLAQVPVLLIRGALSDILSPETLGQMTRRLPRVEAVTVPHIGHAPTLDEPEAAEAIERLLARVATSVG
jgi:pimeloyl-ACP methyl ester carboxylesterase